MADFLTILVVIIIFVALLITSLYLIVYFSHPDDKGSILGWVMKGLAILGFTLTWIQVFMLPFDVSNSRTFGAGMNMKVFWYIIYIIIIIYILLITQIAICFYQADNSWSIKDKFVHSIGWAIGTTFFFLLIAIIFYFTIGNSEIDIISLSCDLSKSLTNSSQIVDNVLADCTIDDKNFLQINVSFAIYLIACFLFCSWSYFAFFGGIGLAAVPIDYFYRLKNRPKHMKSEEVYQRRSKLLRDVEDLRMLGDHIKNLEAKGYNKKFKFSGYRRNYEEKCHEFRAGYMLADKEFEIVNAHMEVRKSGNCVYVCYYILLPLAIISSILSFLWLIQFIVSFFYIKNGRPGLAFMSSMLIFFQDHDVGFLSFFFFGLFSLYLFFCVIKGNFKFGIRNLICWDVYNMKKEGTYMDSFIVNIRIVLFSSFAIIHFCAESFTDYVAMTDIDVIMNIQIKNLRFFHFFFGYHIFHYLFFAIFIFNLIYLIINPSDSKEYRRGMFGYKKKKNKNKNKNLSNINANNTFGNQLNNTTISKTDE